MKKILITQSQLRNYSGSEIVTLELAEYFSINLGWEVSILTHYLSDPISDDFKNLNVKVILSNSSQAAELRLGSYDIVWVHHYTLTPGIVDGFKDEQRSTKIVFNHMSFAEPLESMQYPEFEREAADFIAFNSHSTKDKFLTANGFEETSKIVVLDNPAPDAFHAKPIVGSSKLKHIIVVSNHPPQEVVEAMEILANKNIQVTFIGRTKNGSVRRVVPETLSDADIVITIGKTVQYSIALGKPVYCYDNSGGPGYIDENNYEFTHYRNFSGRGYDKKTSQEIVDEIINCYDDAVRSMKKIRRLYAQNFLLSAKINAIVDSRTNDGGKKVFSDESLYSLRKHSELYAQIIPGYASYIHYARHLTEYELKNAKILIDERKQFGIQNKELTRQKELLNNEIVKYKKYVKYEKYYYDVVNSRSYRIGRAILSPLRLVKKVMK